MKALRITLRRFARRAIVVTASAVLAALLLVLGLLAYLHSAPGRRFLAAKVNAWVSRELIAELRIEGIDVLARDRLVVSGATLFDANGRAVLHVRGVSAPLDLYTLLTNAFSDSARIELPNIRVERLEVGLFQSKTSVLSLIDAFQTRVPSPSSATPSKGPRVHLPKIAVDSVAVRTDLSGLSQATADLRAFRFDFDWVPEQLSLGFGSDDVSVTHALPVPGHGRLHTEIRVPGKTVATLDGKVGELPIQASFSEADGEMTLSLSSASLEPAAMRALLPAWPLSQPASAQVELSGPVAAMRARAQLQAGASQLEATGTVALSPNIQGELSLSGRELDLRLFAPELSRTALGVAGKLAFSLEPAARVDLTAHFSNTDSLGVPLPELDVHALYESKRVTGTATSSDPTLPVSMDFGVSEQGALSFHARAQNLALGALARYGLKARGQVDVDVSAEVAQEKLLATGEARVRALQIAPLRAQAMVVHGKLRGSTANLQQLGLELQAGGQKLALGAAEFPVWALESKGSSTRQLVSLRAGPAAARKLQGSTNVAFERGVSLTDTQLQADLNGVKHRLELKSAQLTSELLMLRELRWQIGAGTLAGSALISPTRKQLEFEARGLEAESISQSLGLSANGVRGTLNAQLRFEESGHVRHGQLKGSFADGAVPGIAGLETEFDATVADSELTGRAKLIARELGRGTLSVRGDLGKAPITEKTLAAMRGEARLEVSDVELREVARRMLPAAPVTLSGRLDGSVRLAKLDANTLSTVSYEFRTRELGLKGKRDDGEGSLLRAELSSRGEIGATQTALQLELKDAAGTWLSARAEQRVGWPELVSALDKSSPALLLDAPLRASISASPRSLELLGSANPLAYGGEVAANFDVTGSPRRPEIAGALTATGLGPGANPSGKLALSLDYSAPRQEYSFTGRYAESGRGKLEVEGGGHWGWFETGFGRDWSIRGRGEIESVALGAIGALVGVPVTGEANGHASFSASESELEATGELTLERLALERHQLGRGELKLRVRRALAEMQLSVVGAKSTLEFSGELGLCWNGGPCIDPKRGGRLDAKVRNYELAAFAPLLRSVASDVRGPVNGFVVLDWDPADAAGKRKTRLRADALVKGGSVTLTGGSGSIQCASLSARGNGDDGILQLQLSGCAGSSKPNIEADAEVLLNGPVPERVNAQVRLGRAPVSYDGVVLGQACTLANAKASCPSQEVDKLARPIQLTLKLAGSPRTVEVSIPALDFELPSKDDTELVDLSEDPSIKVTDVRAPPEANAEDSESALSVSVRLGDAVRISQPGMRIPVTGTLTRSPDGLLDGSIVLPEGGVVPQLGQVFRLKRGSIRFDHQPVAEGVLSIEASTRTADGVVVDLLVSGTIAKPLIRFRSDPPRSENDIVALLLGVQTVDTSTTSGQHGQDLRGSATALAMNQLVRGSVLAGVQFGAGQTHKGDSVSTVSVRAGNSVWLEGRTVRSTTQRAANSGVQSSGVIDWRFARGFSLRTQLGNISGLELRWSHRY